MCAPIVSKSLIIRRPEMDAVPANAVMDNMCAAPMNTAYDEANMLYFHCGVWHT